MSSPVTEPKIRSTLSHHPPLGTSVNWCKYVVELLKRKCITMVAIYFSCSVCVRVCVFTHVRTHTHKHTQTHTSMPTSFKHCCQYTGQTPICCQLLTTLEVGLPAPCPALVSIRANRGLIWAELPPSLHWRVAMNLSEWSGTTLSSWSAVSTKMAGYSPELGMLWSGEYLQSVCKEHYGTVKHWTLFELRMCMYCMYVCAAYSISLSLFLIITPLKLPVYLITNTQKHWWRQQQ